MNFLYLIITFLLMLVHARPGQTSQLHHSHLLQALAKAYTGGKQLTNKCDPVVLQGFLCEPALFVFSALAET